MSELYKPTPEQAAPPHRNPETLDLSLAKNTDEEMFVHFYNGDPIHEAYKGRSGVLTMPGTYKIAGIPSLLAELIPDEVRLVPAYGGGAAEMSVVTKIKRGDGYVVTTDSMRNPEMTTYLVTPQARLISIGGVDPGVPDVESVIKDFSKSFQIIPDNTEAAGALNTELIVAVPKEWTIADVNDMVRRFILKVQRSRVGFTPTFEEEFRPLTLLMERSWTEGLEEELTQARNARS